MRGIAAGAAFTRGMNRRLRVGIIGSTKRGGYGHGMDTAFADAERFEVFAIADDDAEGLAATGRWITGARLYADFRERLAKEKPDIAGIRSKCSADGNVRSTSQSMRHSVPV